MARIPSAPRLERRVTTEAIPGVRRTAAPTALSLGAGVYEEQIRAAQAKGQFAEQLGRVGAVFGKIELEEKQKADELAVLGAENGLSTWTTKRVYDSETGALTVHGKDAMGLPEQVTGEFEKHADEVAATLSNGDQQQAFAKIRLRHLANLDMTLQRHVFQERQRYEASELQSYIENQKSAAVNNAGDVKRVGQELALGVSALKTRAPRLGAGPEEVAQQVQSFTSDVHVGVIERLLAGDQVKAANAYFQEVQKEGQIKGEAVARIEKALEAGTLRKGIQTGADAILAAHPDDLEAQRKAAKAIDDPETRTGVLQLLEHEYSVQETMKRDAHEKLTLQAGNIVAKTGNFLSIPDHIRAELTTGEKGSLMGLAERVAEGAPVVTKPDTRYALTLLASDPKSRDAFVRTNLLEFADKLSKEDMRHFQDVQAAARSGDETKARNLLVDEVQQGKMVDEALLKMGMDPTPPQPGTKPFDQAKTDRVIEFRRSVREAVATIESRTGKKATDAEVQHIVDTFRAPIGKVQTKEAWGPFGLGAKSEDRFGFERKVQNIPVGDIIQIRADLRAAGLPVTNENIVRYYQRLSALGVKKE